MQYNISCDYNFIVPSLFMYSFLKCLRGSTFLQMGPNKKYVILPFATEPKIVKSTVGILKKCLFCYRFLGEKNVLEHSSSFLSLKKKKKNDRPTHVLAPKEQYNIFFCRPSVGLRWGLVW